jgi:hypothetical protein
MTISGFVRCTLTSCVAIATLAACSKANSNAVETAASSPRRTPWTSPPGPPTYVGADYEKPGQPSLTPPQVRLIRETLSRVKPCQRPLVRYVLDGAEAQDVTLFFDVPPGQGAHVFGTAIDVYFPATGDEVPMGQDDPQNRQRVKEGIRWDIDHEPCPRPSQ